MYLELSITCNGHQIYNWKRKKIDLMTEIEILKQFSLVLGAKLAQNSKKNTDNVPKNVM